VTFRKWLVPGVSLALWLAILGTLWSPVAAAVTVALAGVVGSRWIPRGTAFRVGATVALLSAALGVVLTLTHSALRAPAELVDQKTTEGGITVVTSQTLVAGDRYVVGRVVAVGGDRVVSVPAAVYLDDVGTRLAPGVTLEVEGNASATERFDTRAWLIFADSWSVVTPAPVLSQVADDRRSQFRDISLARGGDGGALLPGLALGDTTAVSDSLEADMRVAALAHLVAVSGANCALIVAIAVGLVALFGGGLWWRVGAGVVALIGFVVLVTPEPSVIRASVMATIALIAVAVGRPTAGLQVLSVTVWLLLALDPWRSVDVAFVLSVAATAGIVMGLAPMATWLARLLPRWLALVVALPLVAQLAVQPIVILLRPTIPVYGVLANLLAAPFVPLVTLSGLAGALSTSLVPLAQFFASVGWYPATAIAAIARAVAHMPFAEIPWWSGGLGLVAAGCVSVAVWLIVAGRTRLGSAIGLVTVTLVAATTVGPRLFAQLSMPHSWSIAQCDVGQGDALILRTSEGFVGIDTGNDEYKLRSCLSLLGVRKLRWLVLSHFDVDHVGQTGVYRSRVDTVLTGPPDNADDINRLADLERSGAAIEHVSAGDVIDLGDHSAYVLWPESRTLGEPGNDSSVSILVLPDDGVSGLSLLAVGDLGEQMQRMLMPRIPVGSVDVVKVSHHGSPDQYGTLYQTLRAPLGLIGVGAGNSYGHPASSTLAILASSQTAALRSDTRGTIVLGKDGDGIVVWSERGG
jgi:competence protein ComEC